MLTSEVLNRAADLIEERGWGGDWNDRGGSDAPLCLEGAIFVAAGLDRVGWLQGNVACPSYNAVARYLDMPVPQDGGFDLDGSQRLFSFNDDTGRTAEQVIEVLRAAAVIEQARESQPVEVSA